ncbi:MAG TPA: energy transducer TonB [Anseongella sp.]|nr:energy transducer TonB [Anseongella sp.]
MANYQYSDQQPQWKKALAYSSGVYIAILLVLYFVYIRTQLEKSEEILSGGIEINYGTDEIGMGTDYTSMEEASTSPEANTRPPQEVREEVVSSARPVAEADERRIATQDFEDAPGVKSSNNPEVKPKAVEGPVTANDHSQPEEKKEPVVNQNALYKGSQSTGAGAGDGTGNQAGNQGKQTGNNLSNSYEGTGSGGGGIALNLAGRYFTSRPTIQDEGQTTGKIAVQITVDRSGNVKTAKAGARGTTLSSSALWAKCEQAVLKAKLNPIAQGPELQAGTVVFTFILR